MCVAKMHGRRVYKEHVCVQYTSYILRPLENSKSRINADWRILLFDFSSPVTQPKYYTELLQTRRVTRASTTVLTP